jgi:uncharacterized protein (TIGR03437 family)
VLNSDNDAIVASLMTPGTIYGGLIPSIFRNIYVEDTPRVLFSLKILPPDCSLNGQTSCPMLNPSLEGILNLNIENVFTPASKLENEIGFQTVNGTALIGAMNIGMTNVTITSSNGGAAVLSAANASTLGNIVTNGAHVGLKYSAEPAAQAAPVVNTGGVLNNAGFPVGAPVAPGSIATVFGSGFGTSTAGVTVLIGGIAAPLFGVYGTQIDFQVPWQLSGQTLAPLSVTSADMTSAPVMVPLAGEGPGIFLLNPAELAAVEIAGTTIIAAAAGTFPNSRPAQIGEYITIYCTGLGAVTNQPATGALSSTSTLSYTSSAVTVSIGGVNVPATFSGLAPGYLGLYQVNVQVPANAPVGAAVPITIAIGGKTSNQANIAIAAAGA